MFCEKCKAEYRDGIKVCPVCNISLVDFTEEKNETVFDPNEKACKLCSVADEFEAEIIISKLRSEGVYAYKKLKGIDGYNKILLGRTVLGVDIIVGEKSLEKAREITKSNAL